MRACSGCSCEITHCFGFVKAGDILEHLAGKRAGADIREICGRCAIPALEMNEPELQVFLAQLGW